MIVTRPFAQMKAEIELIALREFVPSASAPLTLNDDADRSVTLATVLPGAAAALTRSTGEVMIGLQTQVHSGDIARDLGAALGWALQAGPGQALTVAQRDGTEKPLGDMIVDEQLEVTVHDDFSWWLDNPDVVEAGSEMALGLERANAAIMPTAKLAGLPGAYWVDAGEKAHLRWVRAEDEATVMAALARLAAAGELDLGEGTRYVGSFRALGCIVPVWDLDRDAHPGEWDAPTAEFATRFAAALAVTEPLDAAARRARDGLLGRQFTLR